MSDVVSLLAEARAAGVSVAADGERLTISGPRGAEEFGRRLLERKAEVRAVLGEAAQDRASRLAALRDRVAVLKGAPGTEAAGRSALDAVLAVADRFAAGDAAMLADLAGLVEDLAKRWRAESVARNGH
jgi:hypothetical protein